MSAGTPHDVTDEMYAAEMTHLLGLADPGDELLIRLQRPQKYRLDLLGEDGLDVIATYTTYGGWNIEGDFLCVYAVDGMKAAYRLPENVQTILTLPKGKHEAPIANEIETSEEVPEDVSDQQEV